MDDNDTVRQERRDIADWHPADVQAALKKRGLSLAGLSVTNAYHPTAAGKALKRSWPALEVVIARAINVSAEEIWPTRYKTRAAEGDRRIRLIKRK